MLEILIWTLMFLIKWSELLHIHLQRLLTLQDIQTKHLSWTHSRRPPWWTWWPVNPVRSRPCSNSVRPDVSGSLRCEGFRWIRWSPGIGPTRCLLSWSIESAWEKITSISNHTISHITHHLEPNGALTDPYMHVNVAWTSAEAMMHVWCLWIIYIYEGISRNTAETAF